MEVDDVTDPCVSLRLPSAAVTPETVSAEMLAGALLVGIIFTALPGMGKYSTSIYLVVEFFGGRGWEGVMMVYNFCSFIMLAGSWP